MYKEDSLSGTFDVAMPQVTVGAASVRWRSRESNQDAYQLEADQGIFVVADGMGGHRGGKRAAKLATNAICRYLQSSKDLISDVPKEKVSQAVHDAFVTANAIVLHEANSSPVYRGIGTTAVSVVLSQDRYFIAGIGDSRCYLIRDNNIARYTVDHTIAELMCETSSINDPNLKHSRHVLYRCIGDPNSDRGPEVKSLVAQPGDFLVLVTDGVSNVVEDDCMKQIVQNSPDPHSASSGIVERAVAAGTTDDATCAVISVGVE